jgi:hypothetical protein
MKRELPPDRLNEAVGVLVRREIEVRLLIPLLDELGKEFGRDKVMAVFARTIEDIARAQGRETAERMGDNSLQAFETSLEAWTRGGAMERLPIESGAKLVRFDVTRCLYAEKYRELGAEDIGFLFSCARDAAWMEGFNPNVRMERSRTIMQGDTRCDFCYELTDGTQKVIPAVPLPNREATPGYAPKEKLTPEQSFKKKFTGLYAMDIDTPAITVAAGGEMPKKKKPGKEPGVPLWKRVGYMLLIVLLLIGLYFAQFGIQKLFTR